MDAGGGDYIQSVYAIGYKFGKIWWLIRRTAKIIQGSVNCFRIGGFARF